MNPVRKKLYEGEIIVASSKPGPGWVETSPEILKAFERAASELEQNNRELAKLEDHVQSLLKTRPNHENF